MRGKHRGEESRQELFMLLGGLGFGLGLEGWELRKLRKLKDMFLRFLFLVMD